MMSRCTREKLNKLGRTARVGDTESGLAIWDKTEWVGVGGERWLFMLKGSRVKATWTFEGTRGWALTKLNRGSIVPPKSEEKTAFEDTMDKMLSELRTRPPTFMQRFWWWLWPWAMPKEKHNGSDAD